MKKTRFRIKYEATIKACLYTKEGKLITTLYDSGFTSLKQVHQTLLSKVCNPPKNTKFSVLNTDSDTYWSNH